MLSLKCVEESRGSLPVRLRFTYSEHWSSDFGSVSTPDLAGNPPSFQTSPPHRPQIPRGPLNSLPITPDYRHETFQRPPSDQQSQLNPQAGGVELDERVIRSDLAPATMLNRLYLSGFSLRFHWLGCSVGSLHCLVKLRPLSGLIPRVGNGLRIRAAKFAPTQLTMSLGLGQLSQVRTLTRISLDKSATKTSVVVDHDG